jgi:transposase-like protein
VIIGRYRRRESSDEEALIGVSVRRVEDITEALWGTRVSPSTVSELNKKIFGTIEAWRSRPIEGEHPYVHLDDIVLKRSWAGEVRKHCAACRRPRDRRSAWLRDRALSGR